MAPFRQLLAQTDKPIVAFGRIIQQLGANQLAAQQAAGFPFLQGLEPTLRALNGLVVPRRAARPRPRRAAAGAAERAFAGDARRDARALRHRAAEEQGGRERRRSRRRGGGDRLSGRARSSARPTFCIRPRPAAWRSASQAARRCKLPPTRWPRRRAPRSRALRIDGFLVQEMVAGVEAIVGARSDPLYGPMLLIGAGGVLVELAKDAALRLLPVTAGDVTAMIDGLKLAQLLAGFRGRPAADRAALEAAALALGRFFLDHRARIADIEINPLMVRDSGAVAVDVRVLWRDDAQGA